MSNVSKYFTHIPPEQYIPGFPTLEEIKRLSPHSSAMLLAKTQQSLDACQLFELIRMTCAQVAENLEGFKAKAIDGPDKPTFAPFEPGSDKYKEAALLIESLKDFCDAESFTVEARGLKARLQGTPKDPIKASPSKTSYN